MSTIITTPSPPDDDGGDNNNDSNNNDLRIACLIPSATIICIELGLINNIVGITHECIEFMLSSDDDDDDTTTTTKKFQLPPRILTRDGLPSPDATQNEIHNAIVKQQSQQQQQQQSQQQCSRNNNIPSLYPLIDEEFIKAKPTLIITQDLCNVCAPTSNQIQEIIINNANNATNDYDDDININKQQPKIKIISLSPMTLEDVADTFTKVADACGINDKGIELRKQWLQKFEKLKTTISTNKKTKNDDSSTATTTTHPNPKMLILEWLDPPFDSGHWTYQMMDYIHVDNAAIVSSKKTNVTHKSIQITWDDVYTKINPTVVIVGCCGFNLQRNYDDANRHSNKLSKLEAAKNKRVFAVNGNKYIANPSPYLFEGAVVLALCAYNQQPSVVEAIKSAFPEYFNNSSSSTTQLLEWKSIDLSKQQDTYLKGKSSHSTSAVKSNNSKHTTNNLPDIEDIVGIETIDDDNKNNGQVVGIGFGQMHKEACSKGLDRYIDPISGYSVFTELGHKKRGYCCGSGCRHCPYGHENIKMESKSTTIQQPSILYKAKTTTSSKDDDDDDEIFSLKNTTTTTIKVLFFSGGKDSFLTIRQLVKDYYYATKNQKFSLVLLTTFDSTTRIIAHQNVHIDVVIKQAKHMNLTLIGVPLRRGSGELYVDRIEKGIDLIKTQLLSSPTTNDVDDNHHHNNNNNNSNNNGNIVLVAGDLHLEHIRDWRQKTFGLKYKLEFPLWKYDYDKLMDDLELSQVPCQISAVTTTTTSDDDDANDDKNSSIIIGVVDIQVGTMFTREFYNQLSLKTNIDGFGEKGEFHSLAMVWKVPRETCLGLKKDVK